MVGKNMKESGEEITFPLWQLLQRTSSVTQKVRRRELRKYHISLREAAVIRIIYKYGQKATPNIIFPVNFISSPTMIYGFLFLYNYRYSHL